MPMPNREQEPITKQFLSAALISDVMLLPCIRHVPRCGRNLALSLGPVSVIGPRGAPQEPDGR